MQPRNHTFPRVLLPKSLLTGSVRTRAAGWLAYLLAASGAAVYAARLIGLMHTQRSSLDEGVYLIKGLLFATGQYVPYQPYGPYMHKMPLAFLIPGVVQAIEPGIRSGRLFAFCLNVLLLVALFLTARRLAAGPSWQRTLWGGGVVWVMALNTSLLKMYTQAISEGLIACLLAWSMFFLLDVEGVESKSRAVNLAVGSLLAGVIVMTRENMLPLVPLVILYVWWGSGWRMGLLSLASSGAVFLAVHLAYWPGPLRNWARWIPAALTPFLDSFRVPQTGVDVYTESYGLAHRVMVFFQAFRFHFAALFGAVTTAVLWPARSRWQSTARFRTAVFLAALLAVLTLAHFYASLLLDYCVHCFPMYLAFFQPVGLLLVVVTAPVWSRGPSVRRVIAAAASLLVIFPGIATSGYKAMMQWPLHVEFSKWLFSIQAPRMREGRILPGTVDLWRMIVNRFGLDADSFVVHTMPVIGSLVLGLLLTLVFILLMWLLYRLFARYAGRSGFAQFAMIAALLLGSLLAPSTVISGGEFVYDCGGDNLASVEAAGAHLAGLIPPGAQVDWRGGITPAVLLYLPEVKLYPPQLDDVYFYRRDGDPDELYRYGYWGPELSEQWLGEADFLVTSTNEPFIDFLPGDYGFQPYGETPPVTVCPAESLGVRVYRRSVE